jgi:hypothetical protein
MSGKAAAYPPALAEVLPDVVHLVGNATNRRLSGITSISRGASAVRSFKTDSTAQVVCTGHSFMRNLHQGFYCLGSADDDSDGSASIPAHAGLESPHDPVAGCFDGFGLDKCASPPEMIGHDRSVPAKVDRILENHARSARWSILRKALRYP